MGNKSNKIVLQSAQRMIVIDQKHGKTLWLNQLPVFPHGYDGLHIWEAGIVLSRHVLYNKEQFAGKTVLELGSGVGIGGLSVAKFTECKKCVLSDYVPEIVDNIKTNAVKNMVSVEVMKLNWLEHQKVTQQFDIVIGSDIVYFGCPVVELYALIRKVLVEGGIAQIIIPDRKNYAELFLKQIEPNQFEVYKKKLEDSLYRQSPLPNKVEGLKEYNLLVDIDFYVYTLVKRPKSSNKGDSDLKEFEDQPMIEKVNSQIKTVEVNHPEIIDVDRQQIQQEEQILAQHVKVQQSFKKKCCKQEIQIEIVQQTDVVESKHADERVNVQQNDIQNTQQLNQQNTKPNEQEQFNQFEQQVGEDQAKNQNEELIKEQQKQKTNKVEEESDINLIKKANQINEGNQDSEKIQANVNQQQVKETETDQQVSQGQDIQTQKQYQQKIQNQEKEEKKQEITLNQTQDLLQQTQQTQQVERDQKLTIESAVEQKIQTQIKPEQEKIQQKQPQNEIGQEQQNVKDVAQQPEKTQGKKKNKKKNKKNN